MQVWVVFRSENSSKQEEHWFATNPQESSTSTRLFVDYKAKKGLFGSSGVTCITQAIWLPSINSCLNQKTSFSTGLKIASHAEATTTFDIIRHGVFREIFSPTKGQKWHLSPVIIRYLLLGQECESQHWDQGSQIPISFTWVFLVVLSPSESINFAIFLWFLLQRAVLWQSPQWFGAESNGLLINSGPCTHLVEPPKITRNGMAKMTTIPIADGLWFDVHFKSFSKIK